MIELDDEQQAARDWFESLRDRICAEFEAIEREAGSDAALRLHALGPRRPGRRAGRRRRPRPDEGPGVREGRGQRLDRRRPLQPRIRRRPSIGAAEDPRFFATGISLVAHMANPHVPAVHMNTRFLTTTRRWFGGGADLNPPIPYEEDTADFHARLRAACAAHDQTYYTRFSKWAEDYFFIPHRGVHRGVGGIFYDHLECVAAARPSRRISPSPATSARPSSTSSRGWCGGGWTTPFDEADRARQLEWRGRYAEFNLIYDRGTLFGLKTGGNVDAILMSLPPLATWS